MNVNLSSNLAPLLLLLLLLPSGGCREQKDVRALPEQGFKGTDATNIVARVDGQPILRASFEQILARRGPGADKSALLDELVTLEATYAKAKAAGFDQKPEVAAALKHLIVSKYQEEQLASTARSPTVSDEEIARYYQDHLPEYGTPGKVRAALLFLSVPIHATPDKKAESVARVDAILAEARQLPTAPPTFGALAAKYSEDQVSRYQGGDIGWVSQGQKDFRWGPQVLDALFALEKPGELSPVIRTTEGAVVVRLMEQKPASIRPLSELKEAIRYRLSRSKTMDQQEDFHAAMKAGLPVDINQSLLDSLKSPAPGIQSPPPGLPGGGQARNDARR